jgi:hypothetical protein
MADTMDRCPPNAVRPNGMKPERVYGEGGPVEFVTTWLEREVTPAWAKEWEKQRQLSLF